MNSPILSNHPVRNPFLEWLGVTVSEWREGYAELTLMSAIHQENWTGHLHGGVICTLLDAAAGYCGVYAAPDALSLTTNFLSSGTGSQLTAKGYLERKGGQYLFFTQRTMAGRCATIGDGSGNIQVHQSVSSSRYMHTYLYAAFPKDIGNAPALVND
jgi:uncharacterized protein (TIGR00369 family)